MKKEKLDFSEMIANTQGIRDKQNQKTKKAPQSVKPLKFEALEGDSQLKLAIIEQLNNSGKTYSDLFNYCAKQAGGNIEAGSKKGSNLINGLKGRNTMIDTTFSLLCDFLDLDIYLVPRGKDGGNDGKEEQ